MFDPIGERYEATSSSTGESVFDTQEMERLSRLPPQRLAEIVVERLMREFMRDVEAHLEQLVKQKQEEENSK
jgi:hypothetical protein